MPENVKPEVSELTKTMLESGLVDKGMAKLMEKWGYLPDGATQYIGDAKFQEATRAALADHIEEVVEKTRDLRETKLDLDRMKWPIEVEIRGPKAMADKAFIWSGTALVDALGRFYFRAQDVDLDWFVAGATWVETQETTKEQWNVRDLKIRRLGRKVMEVQKLFSGEREIAIQVSCDDPVVVDPI